MRSPLGCTFANYYKANLENGLLNTIDNKPQLYARYVDDIILVVKDEEEVKDL